MLVRSNGEHTYFASDIAYHQDKRERGFDRQIDVWGADHHGYVARMKAAYEALGGDPEHLELLIMQLVHLVRGGERAQMSKRAGEFVTLDDLLAEIGVDAARWYLLARSHDTTVDLDLDLAREQSSENPVYYVQYAHARIASMLAKAGEERVRGGAGERASDASGAMGAQRRCTPAERALIEQLLAFPGEVRRGGRAARAAPDRRLRARARPGLHRLLPRLPRARRRARDGRVAADRAVRGDAAHDRPLPGSARGERAGGDVGGGVTSVEARQVGVQAGGVGGARAAAPSSTLPAWRAGVAAPAGQQQRERREQRQERPRAGTR